MSGHARWPYFVFIEWKHFGSKAEHIDNSMQPFVHQLGIKGIITGPEDFACPSIVAIEIGMIDYMILRCNLTCLWPVQTPYVTASYTLSIAVLKKHRYTSTSNGVAPASRNAEATSSLNYLRLVCPYRSRSQEEAV